MALPIHISEGETFVPEYAGIAGVNDFVPRTLDPAWATLVF